MTVLYVVGQMCFHVKILSSLPIVLSGVIAMAMLIIATQLWNRIGACASRKATQKEIMLVSPLSVYVTYEQPQNWDFSPGKNCMYVC